MKAYVIVFGYDDVSEIDSVFMDKEKAEAYVRENNRMPYAEYDKCHIEEVDLNPSSYAKKIVFVHGYYSNKDKKIGLLDIGHVDRETMEIDDLQNLNGNDIKLFPQYRSSIGDVTGFGGRIDITSCKDPRSCVEYIRDVIRKKIEFRNQKDNNDKESK